MSLSLLSRAAHSAPAGPAPFPCQRSQEHGEKHRLAPGMASLKGWASHG